MDLNRQYIGVRAGYVGLSVLCYFGTLLVLARWPDLDQPGTMAALQWLIGALGVAVVGDAVRPSGQAWSVFHPLPSIPSTDEGEPSPASVPAGS